MAISRIRGEQIRQEVLVNQHIASDAAIHESKLDVNWSSHYAEALETKKVVDYVQVGNKAVGGVNNFNLTTNGVLEGTAPIATSAGTTEGVITDAPYNKVVIRDANTGEVIIDPATELEVYGRLVHDGVDFKVLFFTADEDSEDAFVMPADAEIDFQYMERFNLRTISELFAANEKFVAGAADITAFQNIHQLARDIYGSGYSLDRDGEGNLTVSLVKQISDEVDARIEAINTLKANLLQAGEAGKGAHLIGIEDLANVFTAVTVEGALAELEGRLQSVEQSGGVEVEAARNSSVTGAHLTLDARIEADVAELIERLTTEQQRAEAAELALDGRLDILEARVQEDVSDAIAVETTRAVAAEEALDARIDVIESRVQEDVSDAIAVETTRATTAEQAIASDLADEVTRATTAEEAIASDLADEVTRATGVEAQLQTDLTAEVTRATTAEQAIASDLADEVARATAAEEALDGRTDALETEVQTARGTEASLDTRLDRALNGNGTLKAGTQIHSHFRARYQATGGEAEVLLTAFNKVGLPAFQVGDDSLEVYINGQLQEAGLNYQEGANGDKIIFDLSDGTVLEPTDLVQIKYFVNNAE